ncbi:TPA: phage tail protein, partial [Enterobacter hormaechei]|nr:phage tail protein [Enterobacter hormaechei]
MQVGAFGFGGRPSAGFENFDATQTISGVTDNPAPGYNMFGMTILHSVSGYALQYAARNLSGFHWRTLENGVKNPWIKVYDTNNTTKSSDGTLKAASPVARIVASADTCLRSDIAEDGFSWCGCGTANAEAEGI